MSDQPETLRLADEIESLRADAAAELRRLHDALKEYGQHRSDCAVVLGGYQCTCGFNQQVQR